MILFDYADSPTAAAASEKSQGRMRLLPEKICFSLVDLSPRLLKYNLTEMYNSAKEIIRTSELKPIVNKVNPLSKGFIYPISIGEALHPLAWYICGILGILNVP